MTDAALTAAIDSTLPSSRAATERAARALAWTAMVVLTAMVAITFATGVSQEQFEVFRADYGPAIARAAGPLRAIVALDVLFLIAYTAFFVTFVQARGVAGLGVVRLGVGAVLGTALLDMIEDQHLLALARSAADGALVDDATVRFQHVLSQVKFHLSYLGVALIALGLPRTRRRDRAYAWALALPLPILGAVLWAVPALEPTLYVARWLAFLGGFAGALSVLRR